MNRTGFVKWASRLNPFVVDGLLAAFLAVIDVVAMMNNPETPGPGTQGPSLFGAGLLLLENLPLAWRRKRPLVVLVLVIVAFFVYQGAGFPGAPQLALLISLYGVGAYCPRRTARLTAAIAIPLLTVFIILGVIFSEGVTAVQVIPSLVVLITVFMAGEAVRARQAHARTLEERAALLERERDDKARRAVEEERQRIARELHDVIAHNVSVIVVQAGAGRRVAEARPQEAARALGSIEITGRQALGEMRRLLGVLRQDGGEGNALEPQPGMERLPRLLAQIREAGLPVELTVEGDPRPLSPGVDLSAFRIVQEALTNTGRTQDPPGPLCSQPGQRKQGSREAVHGPVVDVRNVPATTHT
jgi:signal transduction histidine kinase